MYMATRMAAMTGHGQACGGRTDGAWDVDGPLMGAVLRKGGAPVFHGESPFKKPTKRTTNQPSTVSIDYRVTEVRQLIAGSFASLSREGREEEFRCDKNGEINNVAVCCYS